MNKTLCLAALAAVLAVAAAADIEDCAPEGNELAQFVEASVAGCTEDDNKCPLMRGHNATITIKFKTKKDIKEVHQIVHGIVASLPIPFPLDNPDGCKNTGLTCPLTKGDHTYQYSLPVKTAYPKVSVKVKWELLNEDKAQIICINIPAIIK